METSTLDGEKNLKPLECVKKGGSSNFMIEIDDKKDILINEVNFHAHVGLPGPTVIQYKFEGGFL